MLERFYRKIFVAIVPDESAHNVTVVGIKNKKLLYKKQKCFEDAEPSTAFFTYIRKYLEESPLHYIALLNPDPNQGAIEGCSLHDIQDEEGEKSVKTLCRDQKWMLYSSLRELEASRGRYERVGLDFIFSPFSVLEHFFADKIGGNLAIYALAQKDSFSLAFFDNGKLEYAHHYPIHTAQIASGETHTVGFSFDLMHEEEEIGIRLDDIENLDDLDIIDDLDDLSSIEDLDTLEEIAEFSEEALAYEEQRPQDSELKDQPDRFNDDYRCFELIQKTLVRFYEEGHCRNRFVETIYIADTHGSSFDLKHYLEEELFLNVMIRKIDIGDEVIALSRIEEGES